MKRLAARVLTVALLAVELPMAALIVLRRPLARARDRWAGRRRCHVCGCTETAACLGPGGRRCWFVGPDLCSDCEPF